MDMRDEVIDYLMTHGFSLTQAEEHIEHLLLEGELEVFHKNMYVDI